MFRSALTLFAASGLAVAWTTPHAAPIGHETPIQHVSAAAKAGSDLAQDAPAAADADDPLPITQITLYRSGVGSFVRSGRVQGDARVGLRFRNEQVNDILKSMVVLDLDGGTVEGATYGSKEPLERRLGSFAIDLSSNPSVADLLNQLRGAPVRITTAEGTTSGTVLGIEHRARPTEGSSVLVAVVTLLTPGGLRSFDIDQLRGFEIQDAELAAELTKALAALAEHRADNTKNVELGFRGQGQRRVAVQYVQETPVWKTSYRLVLPNDTASKEARVQGWAIVENTTDDDWKDVRLSLVAGQPVSFEMDLYQPLFVDRPEVPVPVGIVAGPRSYDRGMPAPQAMREQMEGRRSGQRDASDAFVGKVTADSALGFEPMLGTAMGEAMERAAIASAATAAEVGEVFQYTLDVPVTVGRQQSAMLPILSAEIDAERVSIFNATDGLTSPMRGVRLTNTSDLQLMPGPVAVYDGASYAGDAQVGHVSAGDSRLLAYAVDLDVTARAESTSQSRVTKVRVVRGVLELTNASEWSTLYSFDNADKEQARLIIVEHTRSDGWDYRDIKPDERAAAVDRFRLEVKPGSTAALRLVQTRTDSTQYTLLGFDSGTLAAYVRDGAAPQSVLDALAEVKRRQDAVVEQERLIQSLDNESGAIDRDQQRLRENIAAVNENSELYARYVTKLAEQETRLEQIARERNEARSARDRAQAELERFVSGLNIG